jgi:hypothetical protein
MSRASSRLEDHEARLSALEERADEIERHAKVVESAATSWRVFAQAQERLVLRNGLGELAQLPVHIAELLAARCAIDLRVVEDPKRHAVAFVEEHPDGMRVVARIPRSAFVALDGALAAWKTERSAVQSRSHVGNGSGR